MHVCCTRYIMQTNTNYIFILYICNIGELQTYRNIRNKVNSSRPSFRTCARTWWVNVSTHARRSVHSYANTYVAGSWARPSPRSVALAPPHVHLFLEASKKHHLWNSKKNTKLYTSIESGKHHWHSRGCVPPQSAMPFETKSVNKSGLYGSLVDFFSSPSSVTTRHQCAAVRP